jgi:hypothetical protein
MMRIGIATGSTQKAIPNCRGQSGERLLKALAPELLKRGVQTGSFVMVNIGNGEFVTGRTREEALRRFDMLHPYAIGCVAQFEDIINEPSEGRMIRKHAGAAPTCAKRTPLPRKKSKRPVFPPM